MTKEDWEQLKYFKPDETFKQGTVRVKSFPFPELMDVETMLLLDLLREAWGKPLVVTSSWRSDSEGHSSGMEVDIRISGSVERKKLAKLADTLGFPRIGFYNKHLHIGRNPNLPEGWWAGVSQ